MPSSVMQVGALIGVTDLGAPEAPPLLTVGFRLMDHPDDPWTRRFEAVRQGYPKAVAAAAAVLTAGVAGIGPHPGLEFGGRVVALGAIPPNRRSLPPDDRVAHMGRALAETLGWEWKPYLVQRGEPRVGPDGEALPGAYEAVPAAGERGRFVVVEDCTTRGESLAEIRRILNAHNPGWITTGIALAKSETVEFWETRPDISNRHIPPELDQVWREAFQRAV